MSVIVRQRLAEWLEENDLDAIFISKLMNVRYVSDYTSDDAYLTGSLGMLRNTYTLGTLKVYPYNTEEEVTPDIIKGLSFRVQVNDINSELLSEGEVRL